MTSQFEHFLSTIVTGRVMLVIDATASREATWDTASEIQSEMFSAVNGLEVQLVYFRGDDELITKPWTRNARALGDAMRDVFCRAGRTQFGRALGHAVKEYDRRPFHALVLIGDCCEEMPGALYDRAVALHVPVFAFHEGEDAEAAKIFARLAAIRGGAVAKFNSESPRELAELLKAIAAFAGGGAKALAASEAGRLLLTQMEGRSA
jgi:hypothetical protein